MKNLRKMRATQITNELYDICERLNERLYNLQKDLEGELQPNYRLYIKKSRKLLIAFEITHDRLRAMDRKYHVIEDLGVDYLGCQLSEKKDYWAYFE